jgi:peptidyl-prolyl cis-trans isomerase D
MIRFLQSKNDRLVKAIFVVIIGCVSVGMVLYLIPGFMSGSSSMPNSTYAVIYPNWYSRFVSSGESISQQKVEQAARQQIQQRSPQYASNPVILNFFEQQVGQELVQRQIVLVEAKRLGIQATDEDVRDFLHHHGFEDVLFPKGQFIGDDQYADFIDNRFHMSVADFEQEIKDQIAIDRLRALITAGVSVGDQEVRDSYRKDSVKIKFDYAVISSDDLRKNINPSDAELEAFFKKSAARYANAVPEQRKITYFAFTANELPGGVPQPSQQEIQAYYQAHQSEYNVPKQARSRHVLIPVPAGADAKTDAAAKAKAEDVLKQLKAGGSWDEIAKKYSEDPGSKDKGGELGFANPKTMVPEFDQAIFNNKIGDIAIVKSQFGYHVVQVEERNEEHAQALNEVLPTIQATLVREKVAQAEDSYARKLTDEAAKNGLEKTAANYHLALATTPFVERTGTIAALPDGTQVLTKAFTAKQGDPPQYAPTGEGYAIFQVAGIQAAHSPTFADYKSHILDDYRSEQLPTLLNQKTKELADKAKADGGDLAKAAKEMGATVKTSDMVNSTGQVPDLGAVGQVAPQLFDLKVGDISGPIDSARSGVVAKILDKQEPSADEIAKNFDQTKDQMLQQRRGESFDIFVSTVAADYKKSKRVQINAKPTPASGE